jgi:N-acetylmuramoyl-L-alanine amidase
MKSVALVIGHGPKGDKGAFSKDGKTNELEWNTELVIYIADELKRLGVKVFVVHRAIERIQPVKQTNDTGAECAIEFHLNAADGTASGTEMLYSGSKKGQMFADVLQKAATTILKLPDRGIKIRKSGRGSSWITKTTMPAVLAETFFIDNNKDLERGSAVLVQLAVAYAQTIKNLKL